MGIKFTYPTDGEQNATLEFSVGLGYGYHFIIEDDMSTVLQALQSVKGMPAYSGTDIVEYVNDVIANDPKAAEMLDVSIEGNHLTGELELAVFAPYTRVRYDELPDYYFIQEAEEESDGTPQGLSEFNGHMHRLGVKIGGPNLSDYQTLK